MCVFKYDKDKMEHRVADKDITCYKVMLIYHYPCNINGYQSLVYHGKVYFNDEEMMPYEHKTVEQLDRANCVEGGVIYSYPKKGTAYEDYVMYNHILIYRNAAIVKCVIPKGTPYWVSDDGKTYISMKLKIKGKVDMKVKIKGKVD